MRISDWSSDVCSSDLAAHGMATDVRAPVATETRSHGVCVYRMFRVAGLQMAIQCGEIESFGPMPTPVTASAASVPWLLGTVMHDHPRCHVVDLARVIAPQADAPCAPGAAIYPVGRPIGRASRRA